MAKQKRTPQQVEAIKQEFISKGVSQKTLMKDLAIEAQSYASNLMNGKASISPDRAKELNSLYGLDINILLGLTSNSEAEAPNPKPLPIIEARPTTAMAGPEDFDGNDHKFAYSDEGVVSMRVRVVPAKAQLGYLRGFADPEYFESFDYEIIPVTKEARGSYLGFETVGRSMVNLTSDWWADKSIFPNRIAIGRELSRDKWRDKLHIHSNDAWVVVHKTDGILLKEIVNHDTSTGLITLRSWNPDKSNPEYQDKVLHLDDVAQLFNVLQVVDKRR